MLKAKVMLLGDMGVGKTSIMYRLVYDRFSGDYRTTFGVEILTHDVALDTDNGRKIMRFALWDTDGDFSTQIFDSVYLVGAMAAIIVSDATRPQTITRMIELATAFDTKFPGRPFKALINKADLLQPGRQMYGLADLQNVSFASAKTGWGLAEAAADLAGALYGKLL